MYMRQSHELCGGIAVVGQQTEKRERGRIVPAPISRRRIFKRPSGHRSGEAQGQNKRNNPRRDYAR
jgi:hypothetical protein